MNKETINQSDEMSGHTQSDCSESKKMDSEIARLQENYIELEKNIAEKLQEQKNLIQNILESNKESNKDSEETKNDQLDSILNKLNGIAQIDSILSRLNGIEAILKNELRPEVAQKLGKIETDIQTIPDKIKDIHNEASDIKELSEQFKAIEAILKNELRPEVAQKLGKIETDIQTIPAKIDNILNMASNIRELCEGFEEKDSSSTSNNIGFPPSNEDDELILDLANYGQKIFQQLTIAARHYAQNRNDLDAINKIKIDYENKIKITKEEFFEKGKEEGGKKILENLLSRSQDLDDFFAHDDILKGSQINGLEKDQRFLKGGQVEITPENKPEFEKLAHCESLGKFKVTKSCYTFNGEVIQYAELKAIE
ncbi:MAG: hypothetical protein ACMUJM_22925 [bacterium]